MLALLLLYNRSYDHDLRSLRIFHNAVNYLIDRLARYLTAAYRAVRNAYPGVHKTQIIVYLSYSSDYRTWVLSCRFLVYRNCRRKTFYIFYIRLLHLSEELPCISRYTLHVASLSLRIYSVKRKR